MPKVWNKRNPNVPEDAIYVGRPSKWGNPFVISKNPSRLDVIWKYNLHVVPKLGKEEIKKELKGKDLVCWCAPEPCHADILLEIANK